MGVIAKRRAPLIVVATALVTVASALGGAAAGASPTGAHSTTTGAQGTTTTGAATKSTPATSPRATTTVPRATTTAPRATVPSTTAPRSTTTSKPAAARPQGAATPQKKGTAPTSAVSADGPTGMNLDAAWSKYTTGDPAVTVAYIEGGINWHLSDAATLAKVVKVNWREAPVPCRGATVAAATMVLNGVTQACRTVYSPNKANYDVNHTGVINAAQWNGDPRVTDANHNGVIDPEDLISTFCSPGYHPPAGPSGLPCAISGWDFYNNQNDPATVDTAYQHANDQMNVIHHECPECSILPVKAGDEALDPTDNLAKAWLFAADQGAKVIVSVTADLGYSPYMRQVIDELHRRGVIMVESSNDFDSTDHQGGMFWPHVLPGNGAVVTANGTGWTRSDLTSWGTHNVFTVATSGGSTSESTPTLGGVLALVLSYGIKASAHHLIPHPLTGPEAEQVLRATATPFTNTSLPWPGTPAQKGAPDDWNLQYGYGMPNVARAMAMVSRDRIPVATTITSPDWYTNFDPTRTKNVAVTGAIVGDTPAQRFTWKLEAAPGGQPANKAFTIIGHGSGVGHYSGRLGNLSLATIPRSRWDAPYRGTTNRTLSNTNQYAVTLRLVVRDHSGIVSLDRRAFNVVHDPSLLAGYPRPIDPGSAGRGSGGPSGTDARASGESAPQLAGLQGQGKLDIIFGDSAGFVHAVDPRTGKELPGWPVHVQAIAHPLAGPRIHPGFQPIIATVAVGDLEHNGHLDVVVTTMDGTVDVYNAHGHLLAGWPRHIGAQVTAPPIPRPQEPNVRLPVTETLSSPVLVDLEGNKKLDVVVAGGDGQIHAWAPNGHVVPGWPVKVSLPSGFALKPGYTLENDQRLVATPTVAWFQGHHHPPSIVERSQFTQITGPGVKPLPYSEIFAYSASGRLLSGWPVTVPGLLEYYGSAQGFITEGSSSPVAADVNASGKDVVIDAPIWTPPVEINGAGQILGSYGSNTSAAASLLGAAGASPSACRSSKLHDVPIPFTSSGAVGKVGGTLRYVQSGIGAAGLGCLQHPNAGATLNQYESMFPANAAHGQAAQQVAGFPATREGDGFLTAPVIADVTGNGQPDVIEGGDSSTINAFTPKGQEAAGFPKFTSGWDIWAPSVGDLFSNGRVELVTTTREGYLYVWRTPGRASANTWWWSARHDQYNSGNEGVDSRPPGRLRAGSWSKQGATASFIAPGGNWYDGKVARYLVVAEPSGRPFAVAASATAGSRQHVRGPRGTTGLVITPQDGAGNLGPPARFGSARHRR